MKSTPNGWRVVRLAEVADTALGKMLDRGKPKGLTQVPYLRNVNVQWGRIDTGDLLTMELADEERDRFAVHEGDLLVCEGGEIGRAAIWHGGGAYLAYQKAIHRVRSKGDLYLPYLRYLLEFYSRNGTLTRFSTGSTIAHLPQQRFRELPIPLPSLSEQRQAVEILEDHLSRLDAAGHGLVRGSKGVDAMRLSSLARVRSNLVREGAPLVRIGQVCDTALGKMLDAKKAAGEPTPYLRNINVRWGDFNLSDVQLVPLTEAEKVRLRLRAGDLMVCEGGEPGRCAVWPSNNTEITFQKALHRVRVRDDATATPSFLALMLEEFIRTGRAKPMFTGTTIKHLPQEKLRLIKLPLPALERQRQVVAQLEDVAAHGRRLHHHLRRALAQQEALRRSLLNAAFSGRLTGRSTDIDMVKEMAGV
jgi:type I restriction enzyme S subunit